MEPVGQDAYDKLTYRFGYSFRNPKYVNVPYEAKPEPWFRMRWAAQGPSEVKSKIWRSGRIVRYPSVWRRAGKRANIERLGVDVDRTELHNFNELGQAPGPADKVADTGRNWWGSLENIVSKTADILISQQQAKIARAQSEISARMPVIVEQTSTYFPWVVGIGILGTGAYFMLRR